MLTFRVSPRPSSVVASRCHSVPTATDEHGARRRTVASSGAAALLCAPWCKRLVGGQTGDLIGALGALVEIAVLAALLLFV